MKNRDANNADVNARKAGRAGRKRRAAGWTLLVLGMLVAGVWTWSRWHAYSYGAKGWHAGWASGLLSIAAYDSGQHGFHRDPDWALRPAFVMRAGHDVTNFYTEVRWDLWVASKRLLKPQSRSPQQYAVYEFVIWPIPLLLWAPAVLLLRSGMVARRRVVTNACAKCSYSFAGLGDGAPCPECGRSPTK